MLKKLIVASAILTTSALISTTAYAAGTNCQPIYGGGQTCVQTGPVTINKLVKHPTTNVYVSSLGVNDPKYAPNDNVSFKINVANSGQTNLSKVVVKDMLPDHVSFVSGGNYDSGSRTVTVELSDLKVNETRTVDVVAKANSAEQLPTTACVVNRAQAIFESQVSEANAQFCIEKQVPGAQPTTKGGKEVFPAPKVTTTPSTGPEMLALIGLIPTGLLGHFIRKKF